MTKYNTWQDDLNSAARAIKSISDTVLPKLISGKLHSVENADNDLLLLMDQVSGIDLIRQDCNGLQGVAARVQFGSNFKTFTIRAERRNGAETELAKRLRQIEQGYFYPAFTMQAYFDSRKSLNLMSVAVVKTVDLYRFIQNKPSKVYTNKSDNLFQYCYWRDLKSAGCSIKIFNQ